jgi:glutamate-5-semialdehyde dehydrogenase
VFAPRSENAMTIQPSADTSIYVDLKAARDAGQALAGAPANVRDEILRDLAHRLADPQKQREVLAANARDLALAQEMLFNGELTQSKLDRLRLDESKLNALCEGLRQLSSLEDPIGRRRVHRELDQGLILEQRVTPLGLIAVVFESRPDALVQITSLCLRTGNAVALKGGREAAATNACLHEIVGETLDHFGLDRRLVLLLRDRNEVQDLLKHDDLVELVVARGSSSFVEAIRAASKIPVVGHAAGICHLYLHADADPALSARVVVDAKCSYPAACNAVETILWHADAIAAMQRSIEELRKRGVRVRGCTATRAVFPDLEIASEEDWSCEYGDLIVSVLRVDSLDEAMKHIAHYGSRHTESIICQDRFAAEEFLAKVDAACVFHNASTRFSDGYRFGLGAEVGVSTEKLHARGPVGIEGLCTYRWILHGEGQCTADYGVGRKAFTHRDL